MIIEEDLENCSIEENDDYSDYDEDEEDEELSVKYEVHATLEIDPDSVPIMNKLIKEKCLDKNIFHNAGIDNIVRHATFLHFNNLHLPCEFVFDKGSEDSFLLNKDVNYIFTYLDIKCDIDEKEQTSSFEILFRLAVFNEKDNDLHPIFGVLKCKYINQNPSEEETMELTNAVLKNLSI